MHCVVVYTARTRRERPQTLYTAVFMARVQGPLMYRYMMHGPCIWSVHDRNTALHGCAPCTRACLRKVYTAVHGHMHGPCMAVYKVRTRPWTAVYTGRKDDRVHGTRRCIVRGPCTAVYTVRSQPCTQAVKTTVCTVRGRARGRVRVMYGRVPGPYTP